MRDEGDFQKMTNAEIATAEPLVIDPNAPVLFIDDVAVFGMVGSVVHLTVTTRLFVPQNTQPNVVPKSVVCAHLRIPAYAEPALQEFLGKALLMGTRTEGMS